MRIATSSIYEQQTTSIDNLQYTYANAGNQLSTGKQFNAPSDDPTRVAQDLAVRTTIDNQHQVGINIQGAVAELTTTDSALANLTAVLQSARQLAVQGATNGLTPDQRQAIGNQVDQLLQQSVAIANTDYGGKYIFAGSAAQSTPPVTPQGTPITSVSFSGNLETQGQLIVNRQAFALSTTIQQSFNYRSADGSSDVFTVLRTLRDSIAQGIVVDQSAAAINQAGAVILGRQIAPTDPPPSQLGTAPFGRPLQADSSGNYAITISGTNTAGVASLRTFTFAAATPIDAANPPAGNSVVELINAQTALTGVTASFNAATQRFALSSSTGSFYVADVASAGATNTSNFTKVFGLTPQADFVQNVSTQISDIDHVLDVTLNARSIVGARINALTSIGDQVQTAIVDNTKVQSGIEDVDIAKAVAQFSATQTALQAAYSTTTKLESKTLFDYIG